MSRSLPQTLPLSVIGSLKFLRTTVIKEGEEEEGRGGGAEEAVF